MKRILGILLGAGIFLTSCVSRELGEALNASGENRAELQKVLRHYRNDPEKRDAAVFLIENMPGHYSFGGDFFEDYKHKADSLYPSMPRYKKRLIYDQIANHPKADILLRVEEDIKTITADYLIHHIDFIFRLREKAAWLRKSCGTEDFYEYILPYSWRNQRLEAADYEEMERMTDEFAAYASQYGIGYTDIMDQYQNADFKYLALDRLVLEEPLKVPYRKEAFYPQCMEYACYHNYFLRSIGIPATFDFVPFWGNMNGSHFWTNLVGRIRPDFRTGFVDEYRIAKVYRETYSKNPAPERRSPATYIPSVFRTPFIKDVTEAYVPVSDIAVRFMGSKNKDGYGYLAVFNNMALYPVAWAEKGWGKTVGFEKMGRGILYFPVSYSETGIQQWENHPFELCYDGQARYFPPNHDSLVTVTAYRKFPVNQDKIKRSERMYRSMFVASNDPDFRSADTAHIIPRNPALHMMTASVEPAKTYRYWRFVPSDWCELAELAFYDAKGEKITGEISLGTIPGDYRNMTDGDPLSSAAVYQWFGIDFKRPVAVSAIDYLPRSDDNAISPGDKYELFYYDTSGWASCGKQVAGHHFISFDSVPSGAVYWLRNLTKGREERPFTIEDGTQRFW